MSTSDSTAGAVMTHAVLGIVPATPLVMALRMMVEARVHHFPVVDRGCCVGLLHESDVLWRLWSRAGTTAPPAGAVARTPVVSVAVSDDVRTIARRMTDAATDAAVVIDGTPGDERIVGIVTATDLLRRLGRS